MGFPGSDRLLRHAGRQLGGRVVRELGIPNSIGNALGLTDADGQGKEQTDAARQRQSARRSLRAIDKPAERAIGERAFQASLAYLDTSGLTPQAQSSLAQAIAHAVVEALDEYAHRAMEQDAVISVEPGEPPLADLPPSQPLVDER